MTKQDTLALIQTTQVDPMAGARDNAVWMARSEWVLTRYGDFMATGEYPYLARVAEWIAKAEGWPLGGHEVKHLTTLVYHACEEWRRRKDIAEGWQRASEAALTGLVGQTVQVRIEGMLGNSIKTCRVVLGSNGQIAFMPPRCRTKGYWATPNRKFRRITTTQEGRTP